MKVTKEILSQDAFKSAASGDEIRFRLDPNLDVVLFERMLGELCKEEKLVRTETRVSHTELRGATFLRSGKTGREACRICQESGLWRLSPPEHSGSFTEKAITHREVEKVARPPSCPEEARSAERRAFLTSEAMQEITAEGERADPAKREPDDSGLQGDPRLREEQGYSGARLPGRYRLDLPRWQCSRPPIGESLLCSSWQSQIDARAAVLSRL